MSRVHVIVVALCISFLSVCLLFVPFDTELVPEWKLHVISENGESLSDVAIEQSWKQYSFPESRFPSADGYELKRSDANGYVTFSAKPLRASLASRVIFPILAFVGQLAHGSMGLTVHVRVFDQPRNYYSNSEDMIFWNQGEPPPLTIIASQGD